MKLTRIIASVFGVGMIGATLGGTVYLNKKSLQEEKKLQEKYRSYYELTYNWLQNKNDGKKLQEYFIENNINNVAIYGRGTLGELFYKEIKNTDIDIRYFIDKNVEEVYDYEANIPIIGIEHIREQDEVDAIVITPIFDYDEIKKELEMKGVMSVILSLEDVIYI